MSQMMKSCYLLLLQKFWLRLYFCIALPYIFPRLPFSASNESLQQPVQEFLYIG